MSYAALALILAFAAYLRFRGLGDDSLWRDEAASWEQAQGSLRDIIVATAADNYPPLHNLLLALSMRLFGDGEWALRLPSAICGVLTVAAIYWVGTLVAGRMTGLLSSLFLALSGFHIWFSQEARMYALLALTATLFAGAAIRYSRDPTTPWAIAVVVAGVALLYSHPYGALTWLSIALALSAVVFRRPASGGMTLRQWLVLQAIIVAAFLPWVWVLLSRAAEIMDRGFWIGYPTPDFVADHISRLVTGPAMLFLLGLGVLMAFVREIEPQPGSASSPAARLKMAASPVELVLLAWALGPLVLGYLASVIATPVLYSRYLIGSLPAVLLLASIGLTRFASGRIATLAVFALAAGAAWLGMTRDSPGAREDWRGVGELLAETFRPSNCLLATEKGGTTAISYYYRQPIDCVFYAATPDQVQPGRIPSDLVFAVLYRTRAENARVIRAFTDPPWHVGGQVPFHRIDVVAVVRR